MKAAGEKKAKHKTKQKQKQISKALAILYSCEPCELQ